MLFLYGIYIDGFNKEKQVFKRIKAPTVIELNALVHKLSKRVARFLTKQGLLVEDSDNSYLNLDGLVPKPPVNSMSAVDRNVLKVLVLNFEC